MIQVIKSSGTRRPELSDEEISRLAEAARELGWLFEEKKEKPYPRKYSTPGYGVPKEWEAPIIYAPYPPLDIEM